MGRLTTPPGFHPSVRGLAPEPVVKLFHASRTDVHGRRTVVVGAEAALRTDVFVPVPVSGVLVYVAAVRACPACVRRIDVDHAYPLGGRPVFDLRLQVVVRPGYVQVAVLALHHFRGGADAGEVLQDYDGTGFETGHECLGDARIGVVHPAGFSVPDALQPSS